MPRKNAAAAAAEPTIGAEGWRPTEVHPLAALFPMMPDDELAELADDIRENGLQSPIVIDANGVLIDGRNRLAACELAEVEPTYQHLNGHDPIAFIASANISRRNLTKGQRAMALAMMYPETEKRGRGHKAKSLENNDFAASYLRKARAVLRYSPGSAEEVMSGMSSLDRAYDATRRLIMDQEDESETEREAREKAEAAAAALQERAELLTVNYPKLADRLARGLLSAEEVITEIETREREEAERKAAEAERNAEFERNKRATIQRLTLAAWQGLSAFTSEDFTNETIERLDDAEFRRELLRILRLDSEQANDAEDTGVTRFFSVIDRLLDLEGASS